MDKQDIVRQILSKYNLSEAETIRIPDRKAVRSHLLYATDPHNVKYSVKVFASNDDNARDRFIDEIGYMRTIRSKLPPQYKAWMPKIRWYCKSGKNPYYIYSYIDGEPLGKFVEDYGIKWGNFSHKNFYQFLGFFDAIHSLRASDMFPEPRSWGSRTARKELQYYFDYKDPIIGSSFSDIPGSVVSGLLPSELYDEIVNFTDSYRDKAFRYKILSHRDLYPENILIDSPGSRRFVFLDWEYLSLVPAGFDAAFLYLLFWREEYWMAKVFAYYHNKYERDPRPAAKAMFEYSFRFCLISLAVRFLYQIRAFGDTSTSEYSHARLSYLAAIENALSGSIVRPRNIKFFIEKRDIEKVAAEYGIEGVKNYAVFYASKGNTVAKVVASNGDIYIFRFYSQSRSKALILRELRIFEKLNSAGIKTYDVLPTKSDRLYLEYKLYGKVRRIAVLTYIKGSKIKRRWANEKAAGEVGSMLRNIHDQNIIHGDFSKENVLFQKGKVSGVIDFEWGRFTVSRKAKFNDMAKAIALWLVDVRARNISDDVFIREFIKGYYGRIPNAQRLEKVAETIIQKIEDERQIFTTTIDKKLTDAPIKLGKRFDSAIRSVRATIQ